MVQSNERVSTTLVEEPRYPPPIARRRSATASCGNSSRGTRTSGFSWFRFSVGGGPPDPVDELSLYMGTAFSSIPEDLSIRSPSYAPPWSPGLSTFTDGSTSKKYIIDWEPEDPDNPMDWPMSWRWIQIVLASILTLQAAIASSMPAPAVPEILKQFGAPEGALSSLVISIFNLGFVFGPVLAAPMSELYGRHPAYVVSNILFLGCNAACAASPNLGVLLAFRFLSGCAGSAPLSIGGGTIADVAPPALRGRAVSIYSIAPLLGPVIGPAAGGYLSYFVGWRWVFWTLSIMAALMQIVMLFFLKETSAKVLLERKTEKIRVFTRNPTYMSALDDGIPPKEAFSRAIKRPLRLLLFHPLVLSLSAYFAVIYGYLYLFFATLAMVFTKQYGFSVGSSGFTFIGVGIGTVCGTLLVSFWGDRLVCSLAEKEGEARPEFRLPLMAYSVPLIPGGLLLYGWTAERNIFWLVPMIGTTIIGIGIMFVFTPLASYLVDAFTFHAASALAASTIFRSIFGAFLPLAGPLLYDSLGLGWGNTVLAGVALMMAPIPYVIMRHGGAIRSRYAHRVY